jgi:D-alanyl-D-alanine dipeptidase
MLVNGFSTVIAGERRSIDAGLPMGFVYLDEIDPSIKVDLKYASSDNFTGKQVIGYHKPVVIITKRAADALKEVQKELKAQGYSLVIYDAYRPAKAVKHFVNWARGEDRERKDEFYPNVKKSDIIPLGYIAEQSSHSRGSAVDVTIIRIDQEMSLPRIIKRLLLDGSQILHRDDNTEDMGTHFDFFGEASWHDSNNIDGSCSARRMILKKAMEKQGFAAFDKEWWHYTLKNEPFPKTYFDFDVR